MISIIKSNFIRNKRNTLIWVTLLAPLIYSLLFSMYIAATNTLKNQEIFTFFGFFVILATFSLSFFVPMAYEADKEAGYYVNDIKIYISRNKTFLGKFLFIAILYALIVALASLIIFTAAKIIGISIPNYQTNLVLIAISFLTLIPLIPIYQYLTLKFGKSISILAGIFFTLGAILFGTTGLIDLIWPIFPFIWPVKLIFLYSKISIESIRIFLSLAILLTLIFLIFAMAWFNKWDVYAKTED